jgi:hypothetical protein
MMSMQVCFEVEPDIKLNGMRKIGYIRSTTEVVQATILISA